MPIEYNKSHTQGTLKKNEKNATLHNFELFLWRNIVHRVSSLEKNKSTRPKRLRVVICVLVFGNTRTRIEIVLP